MCVVEVTNCSEQPLDDLALDVFSDDERFAGARDGTHLRVRDFF